MIEADLLAELERRALPGGKVIVSEHVLARALRADASVLAEGLRRLEDRGEVRTLSGPPYLVLKLVSWSGRAQEQADSALSGYSYSFQTQMQLKKSYSYPASPELMDEILETLGETDPALFDGAIRRYSPERIRKALARVRQTKAFRKTPTALFRYLLTR